MYTRGQKYKTTQKNEEKYIVYNFYVTKIRYMKDKSYKQLNLKYKDISIHFYMYINIHAKSSFFFVINIKPPIKYKEKKDLENVLYI